MVIIHNSLKRIALRYNSILSHQIQRITSINFYFFDIIKKSINSKVSRPCKRSYAISITKLPRLCMCYTYIIFRFNDSYLYSFFRNQVSQTLKELLLIFIKSLTQFFKISQVHTIYYATYCTIDNRFLIFFRYNLVDDKTHNSAFCNKRSKAFCQYTNSGRTEIAQLQIETATVLQSIIKKPFWRKFFSRYIGSILSPFYIFQHRRPSDYILVIKS